MCDQSRGPCLLPEATCTWKGMEGREPGAWDRQPPWHPKGVQAPWSEPGGSKCSVACLRLSSLGEASGGGP